MKYVNIVVFWVLAWSIGQSQVVLNGVEAFGFVNDYTDMDRDGAVEELGGFALELREILPDTLGFREDFKVFDGGYYQIQSAMDPSFGTPFDELVNQAASASPYYLVFARASDAEGLAKKIQVGLKLPTSGPFDSMDLAKQNMIRTLVEQEVNSCSYNLGFGWAYGETVGIEKLGDLLSEYLEGGLDFDESMLLTNGFELAHQTVVLTKDEADKVQGMIDDFAGYAEVQSNIMSGMIDVDFGGSVKVLITDDDNYPLDFNEAYSRFDSETAAAVVLWIHLNGAGSNKKVYFKGKSNISVMEAQARVLEVYNEVKGLDVTALTEGNGVESGYSCSFDRNWRAKQCLKDEMILAFEGDELSAGVTCGVIDGLVENVIFIYELGKGLYKHLEHTPLSPIWITSVLDKIYEEGSITKGLMNQIDEDLEYYKELLAAFNAFAGMTVSDWKNIGVQIFESLKKTWGDFKGENGDFLQGHVYGVLVFEACLAFFTGGGQTLVKIGEGGLGLMRRLTNPTGIKEAILEGMKSTKLAGKKLLCKMLASGCFVKNTLVQTYGEWVQHGRAAGVMLAGLPMVTMPIQEVSLLDYVLTDKGVYAESGRQDLAMVGSTDEVWTGLLEAGDEYTSLQQVERDGYNLEGEDWYAVHLENKILGSECQLALPWRWMEREGGYEMGQMKRLTLPEQGIDGWYYVRDKKKIQGPKVPVSEHGEYVWKPITGIFRHKTSEILRIEVTSCEGRRKEELGVTSQHPIYSMTRREWISAGALQEGERIRCMRGEGVIGAIRREEGEIEVYNLEVKDVHNYLVTESGITVHNACKWVDVQKFLNKPSLILDLADGKIKTNLKKLSDWGQTGNRKFDDFLNDFSGKDVPIEHLDAWEFVSKCPSEVRKNNIVLEGISTALQRGTQNIQDALNAIPNFTQMTLEKAEHILRGNGGPTGGVHHISALLERSELSLKNIETVLPNGCYKARVQFPGGQYPPKDFFPNEWSETKVLEQIKSAFDNGLTPEPALGTNAYRGLTTEGVDIVIYMQNTTGPIITAYPIIP